MTQDLRGPLHGVVILDLTQQLAGPGGTMLLGDMGADVIRVDPPPGEAQYSAGVLPDGRMRYQLNVSRSKRAISVDLEQPAGREIVYALARRADVVAQNYKPGVASKLGVDREAMRKVNPDLIYSTVSAYGDLGPHSHRPGFDLIAQAGAGTMVADPKNPGLPAPTRVPVADVTAFCLEALGIVAALYHRKATGTAQAVGTSMVAGALLQNILSTVSVEKEDAEWRAATQVAVEELIAQGVTYNDILDVTATGIGGRRTVVSGGANPMMSVYYRSYRTKDGYVALGCLNVRQQRRLNEALELHDPRFEPGATSASISSPEASARFDQMEEAAEREFMTRTTSDWLSFLDERGIACGPVLNLLQVLDSSHHLENEMIVGHEDPWAGTVRLMGFPIRFEETRMRIQRPAAPSGYHTDEVLAWLDYSPDQIRALREEKVVFG